MNIDKLKTRIAALLKKARDVAATESEASAAMQMALDLSDKYGVTIADIEAGEKPKVTEYRFKSHPDKKALHEVDNMLGTAIGNFCDVKPWANRNAGEMVYCGLEADVELALYIRETLRKTLEFEYGIYKNFVHTGPLKGARIAFSTMFAIRVSDRMKEFKTKTAHYDRSKTALIVLKGGLIETYLADKGISLGASRRSKAPKSWNADAANAGGNAGAKADIGRGVASNAGLLT